jgi:hypothetical protein
LRFLIFGETEDDEVRGVTLNDEIGVKDDERVWGRK